MNCTDHRAEVSSIDNAGASISKLISIGSQARQATSIRFAIIEHILEHDSGNDLASFISFFSSSNFVARIGRHGDTNTIHQGHTILNADYLSSFTI